MKKIIKNKVYNTDTAKKIAEYDNGLGYNDLRYYSETLYQKKTGEYFLYGEGNASSKYAFSIGNNNWTSGWEIIPIYFESARNWAEENLTAEQYESIFGEIPEDHSKHIITISISASTLEKAKRDAARSQTSLSTYIESKLNQ